MLEAGYEKLDGEGARSLKKWRVRVCVCVCSLCVGGGELKLDTAAHFPQCNPVA